MKSLRSSGTSTASRTAAKSSRLPPNHRGSVSTLTQRAPPRAYCRARSAGSGISASLPRDGEARLTSAMTPTPAARRAAYASFGGCAVAARRLICSSGTSSCRFATSSRTLARISSSTWPGSPCLAGSGCAPASDAGLPSPAVMSPMLGARRCRASLGVWHAPPRGLVHNGQPAWHVTSIWSAGRVLTAVDGVPELPPAPVALPPRRWRWGLAVVPATHAGPGASPYRREDAGAGHGETAERTDQRPTSRCAVDDRVARAREDTGAAEHEDGRHDEPARAPGGRQRGGSGERHEPQRRQPPEEREPGTDHAAGHGHDELASPGHLAFHLAGHLAGRSVSAAAIAASTAAALLRHSVSSASGSESATIPAPAWT